jgi:hypothetical protein
LEWLVAQFFYSYLFLHGNGFFYGSSFLDEGGFELKLCWILVHLILVLHSLASIEFNGAHNPLAFLSYPLAIIAHFPHDLGTNAYNVFLKFTKGPLRKGLGR